MIVCLMAVSMTQNVRDRLSVEALQQSCTLHFLDIRPILGLHTTTAEDALKEESLTAMRDWAQLSRTLRELAPSIVLDISSPNFLLRRIAWESKRGRFLLIKIRDGSLPNPSFWRRMLIRVQSVTRRRSTPFIAEIATVAETGVRFALAKSLLRDIFHLVREFVSKRIGPKVDVELFAGLEALKKSTHRAGLSVNIASIDLERISASNPIAADRLVFLDDAISDAKDYEIIGIPSPIEPSRYYPWLKAALSHLSNKFNCRVVIAIHPDNHHKVKFYKKAFPDFDCEVGQSFDLLQECKFAAFHKSTLALCAVEAKAIPISLSLPSSSDLMTRSYVEAFCRTIGADVLNFQNDSEDSTLISYEQNYRPEELAKRIREQFLGNASMKRADLVVSAANFMSLGWPKDDVINKLREETSGVT